MSRIAIPRRDVAPAEAQPILDSVHKHAGLISTGGCRSARRRSALMGSLSKTLETRHGIALAVSESDACDYCLAAYSYQDRTDRDRTEPAGPLGRSQARGAIRFAKPLMKSAARSRRRDSTPFARLGGPTPTSSRSLG